MPSPTYTSIQSQDSSTEEREDIEEQVHDEDNEEVDDVNNRHGQNDDTVSLAVAFWLLGLFNNSSYVIMIASAKSISEGGTALVFLANVLPSFLIKLTAPYWFDHVSYEKRMMMSGVCMVCAFGIVASLSSSAAAHHDADLSSTAATISTTTMFQLLGVALGSCQTGMGEASLLAASGKCDTSGTGLCVTCFSSGTGLAGVFGFLWKFVFNEFFQFTMATTLWMAQSLAVAYLGIFWYYLHPHLVSSEEGYRDLALTQEEEEPLELTTYQHQNSDKSTINNKSTDNVDVANDLNTDINASSGSDDVLATAAEDAEQQLHHHHPQQHHTKKAVHEMTVLERAGLVLHLWPYIIPLFVVYAAEYSLQAGTWTAIGFPVSNEAARDKFYEFSNWLYQAGVFVSRSSGMLGTSPMALLWLMPGLQVLNVVFFAYVAADHFWYSYSALMPVCFYVGLLGGAVYVHGYKRICADFACVDRREFALAATSVAESLGIVCADFMGLFIQSCLYRTNGISGAIVKCPA